jgi:hypothetical protein
VAAAQDANGILRRFHQVDVRPILGRDQAVALHDAELPPEMLPEVRDEEEHREVRDLVGLDERQRLEGLVEGPYFTNISFRTKK